MRRVLTNILVVLFTITSLEAAHRPTHPGPVSPKGNAVAAHRQKPRKPYQVGKASWYGKRFHGKTTASGEPYNMFQLTAAHRRLPLGSLVKVTNLENGEVVIVRINDRGPVPRSRIIDLSYSAARVIHMREPGIQMVRLDVLEEPQTVAMAADSAGSYPETR